MNEKLHEKGITYTHERWCQGCSAQTVHRTYLSGYRGRVTVTIICLACGHSGGRVC